MAFPLPDIEQPHARLVIIDWVLGVVIARGQHVGVEAVLAGVKEDVVVGAQLELEVALVVGSDVHDYGDERSLERNGWFDNP